MKKIILALSLMITGAASANTMSTAIAQNFLSSVSQELMDDTSTLAFDWKVGDTASYAMNMGFIQGTIIMTIKNLTSETLVINQNIDMGFLGKQDCDMSINPNTGETQKIVCNGKEQEAPSKDDMEVVSMEEADVSVKAGQFKCLHITLKNKSDGKTTEQWANPKLVPVTGMIKMKAPSPMGEMTAELTSYKKM